MSRAELARLGACSYTARRKNRRSRALFSLRALGSPRRSPDPSEHFFGNPSAPDARSWWRTNIRVAVERAAGICLRAPAWEGFRPSSGDQKGNADVAQNKKEVVQAGSCFRRERRSHSFLVSDRVTCAPNAAGASPTRSRASGSGLSKGEVLRPRPHGARF
jgi:hypothetical protein